jgi:ABC-2 type transport system ATP-binding protein
VATTSPAIEAVGLQKRFGDKRALDGLSLSVPAGSVCGLLGPNGAGKTTAVRILTTLTRLDEGEARVGGYDVVRQPHQVRRLIGLTGQSAAVDEILTGRQNLVMFGRLFHLDRSAARRRAEELLEQFQLVEAAEEQAKTYSGGMRRRLDLASSMVLAPHVLFLDEPTTGLDPRGRNEVWESLRQLAHAGTTVLLTTHYLDEADRLSDRIAVIDRGRNVIDDTPGGLKRTVGGERVEIVVRDRADIELAEQLLATVSAAGAPQIDQESMRLHAPVADGVTALASVARRIADAGLAVDDVGLRGPTLDEVFLQLTGRPAEDDGSRSDRDSAQTAGDEGARV